MEVGLLYKELFFIRVFFFLNHIALLRWSYLFIAWGWHVIRPDFAHLMDVKWYFIIVIIIVIVCPSLTTSEV